MKQLAIIAIVVCAFSTSCNQKDTHTANLGRRTVEPRLTGVSEWRPCARTLREGHVVEEANCRSADIPPAPECDAVFTAHDDAMAAFTAQPVCLDSAIAALEELGARAPAARNDLAALYYVRAQRDDEPLDLLRALDEARVATATPRSSPEALFNRALILEALGLANDAIASWEEFLALENRTPWANEARQHRDKLRHALDNDATRQWEVQRARLANALRKGDPAAVTVLIRSFPRSAQIYFEEEILAQWATDPSNENLAAARTLALALSTRLGGDPNNIDMVRAIENAMPSPEQLAVLALGHVTFKQARADEKARRWKKAQEHYEEAAELLRRGASPLQLHADLGHALALEFDREGSSRTLPMLDRLQAAASAGRYSTLLMRIQATRAFVLSYDSRHVDALAESDRAVRGSIALTDEESRASLEIRRVGYLRIVGQYEQAWRTALEQLRAVTRLVELRESHSLLGEAADSVMDLGHPEAALLYQSDTILVIRRRLAEAPAENVDRVLGVKQNLSIALRARAKIRNRLGDYSGARVDLDEASLLKPAQEDEHNRRALEARFLQVDGQTLLPTRPNQAVRAFTRALAAAGDDELRTFRASVLVQRAEAFGRLGDAVSTERDLTTALDELRAEEADALARRRRGEGESLWSDFFARSQETYRLLIRYYAEQELHENAFRVAERARAFEPLDLILQLQDIPPDFRALTVGGNSLSLADIQRFLPPGTFLIQYSIHEDRTYAWILSRGQFRLATLPADAEGVARWTNNLQTAARKRSERLFDSALEEPYASLVSTPLAVIETMPGGRDPARRLVVIPDGAMHGLPIAALKDRKTGRHLVESATVEIAGSATLYVFSLLRKAQLSSTQEPAPSALLIGDPAVDAQLSAAYDLRPLSGARLEVERLQSIYGPTSEVRTGGMATVPELMQQAPRSAVVHIAAHAVANAREPTRSTLFLAPSPGHTGALEATELMKRLRPGQTRLVVLAACSSAGGVPVGPEGLAPLVRPFLTSGVPAVIGSLWDVNDATAEPLLVSFHRDYRQSGDAALALQGAQRKLLGNNKKAGRKSALAWAPFQVIGH